MHGECLNTMVFDGLAVTAVCAGAACLYAATPRQRWLKTALAPRTGVMVGGFLSALGFAAWCAAVAPATAVFATLVTLMCALMAFPALTALAFGLRKERA